MQESMPRDSGAVTRREDIRFITGAGRYTGDVRSDGMLFAAIVRSIHPHASIDGVETEAARSSPGVVAVLTSPDAESDGILDLSGPVSIPSSKDGPLTTRRPALAGRRARYVGEPIALVVAESAAAAHDAAELVEVAYTTLPGLALTEHALAANAPTIWEDFPGNVAFEVRMGNADAVGKAFAAAAHVTRAEIDVTRVTAAPLEPRVSTGDVEGGRLVLRSSHQSPHALRAGLARIFRVDPSEIRVIAEDVGGSFGMKGGVYAEDVLVLWAARRLGRPVCWTSGRSEAFLSDENGRDVNARTELALDGDGNFLAFRVRYDVNIGAYLSSRSLAPLNNIGGIAGVYRTPYIAAEIRGIFSNTVPTAPYRGAGRPEATYVLERTIDMAARELGVDASDLRRRNLVPPEAMPFKTGLVFTYDCGEFAANMDKASELIDRAGFDARREESRCRGKLRGLGMSNPIEVAGGPYSKPGKDISRVTVRPDSEIILECGIMSVGQGLETAMIRLAALQLKTLPERISYRQGDTDRLSHGKGSGGSGGLSIGGSAVARAVARLIENARLLAADHLEVAETDLEYEASGFRVAGTDRVVSLTELAAYVAESGPADSTLSGEAEFQPEKVTFPNGCHMCEVEIDPETGKVDIVAYVAVEDVGRVLNPTLVEGQMHGGIAQGVGQALKEAVIHDENGELLTGSFNDYAMPFASDLTAFRLATREVPTAVNPLGVKGVGEAGTVGSLAATMNAICDALADVGVRHINMPATPARVWSAIQAARSG